MAESEIEIPLAADAALVLFEFAARFTEDERLVIEHEAETAALWQLCGALERTLVEVLAADYGELLGAARDRLAEKAGGDRG